MTDASKNLKQRPDQVADSTKPCIRCGVREADYVYFSRNTGGYNPKPSVCSSCGNEAHALALWSEAEQRLARAKRCRLIDDRSIDRIRESLWALMRADMKPTAAGHAACIAAAIETAIPCSAYRRLQEAEARAAEHPSWPALIADL